MLIKDLGLSIKKIDACKNGCMLYSKDDVDLEHYKFYGEARYKPFRRRDPRQKKSPYTPHLQRLYSSRATLEHMTWHGNIRQRRDRCGIHSMPRRGSILIKCISIFQ
ncbi:UNVERIFIED_CONTAM: hypothetical protein Sangu_2734100 [Sesamum angustifolium]|uniref:Uncharacterized protein n=1 Tax=Sesamum angustifolium TaxID=2727405 RepID=A0AAW2IWB6_9LAMI